MNLNDIKDVQLGPIKIQKLVEMLSEYRLSQGVGST